MDLRGIARFKEVEIWRWNGGKGVGRWSWERDGETLYFWVQVYVRPWPAPCLVVFLDIKRDRLWRPGMN